MSSSTTSSETAGIPDSRQRDLVRTLQIAVLLTTTLLHIIFLAKAKPLQSANDRSRWCTIWSLVERGTFQIDEIRQRPGWDTIDLIRVDEHYYSTKPPLLTTIIAGITWCVQRTTGWTMDNHLQGVTFVVLLIVNILPFFLSLLAWIGILDRVANQPWTRFFVLLVAASGTLVTPFLMTLNNHTVATASCTFALYALVRILYDSPEQSRPWTYALCGFASAWTVVNELPAASLAGLFFLLAFRVSRPKTLIAFIPAALIPIVAFQITNVIATGTWKPAYADYGTEKYRFIVDGIPSYWMEPHGVDRNLDSPMTYFIHCTVGHHGLFSLSPIALLALAGWLMATRKIPRGLKQLLVAGAVTSVVVIGFYMTRTQNYNYGGVSCGLRWALWLTPLWLLATVPVLDILATSMTGRAIALCLGLASTYSAWQPIDNPWRQPWLFQWMEYRGWIDYSEERPKLEKPLWTWFPSLPRPTNGEEAWIEFKVAQANRSFRLVRLTGRNSPRPTAPDLFELEIKETWPDGSQPPRVRTLLIDRASFEGGASPADFLRWTDPKITEVTQMDDLAFVRGLPRKVPYSLRAIRYLRTTLRKEALKCQIVAAHVAVRETESDSPTVHRCEAWLSEDVPFGVAKIEFHVNQVDDANVLFHERWMIHACSPQVLPYQKP